MACEHGWHSEADCDACTASRVIPAAMDRIAELESALDDIHMHASPGAPGWIMVPFTEWVQAFKRVGFPKSEQK